MTSLAERRITPVVQHSEQQPPPSVTVFSSTERPPNVAVFFQPFAPLSARQPSRQRITMEGGCFKQRKPRWRRVPERPGELPYEKNEWNSDCGDGQTGNLWIQVPGGKRPPHHTPRLPFRRRRGSR